MNPRTTLPGTYIVTKLIDLQTPYPDIAAKTGLTEDYVREIEAWTKAVADLSAQTRGILTATETLVLWYLLNPAATAIQPREESQGVFEIGDLYGMA